MLARAGWNLLRAVLGENRETDKRSLTSVEHALWQERQATMAPRLPMSAPDISADDIAAVVAVLNSGTLALGPASLAFEQAMADYVGAAHAIAVNSGTSGLHLCVRAAGIGPGDEVVTSPFSFVASANCMLFEGAVPVFADIDAETMCLDPARVEAALTPHTRGILPVHVFGQPAAMAPLGEIAGAHDLVVIEDACEALGAEYRGQRVGTFGQSACFSFYPNKQMTTGEGAIVVTDCDRTAAAIRSMRNQGRGAMGAWLEHEVLGYNYRMTEMSAALGVSQLSRIETILAARAAAAARYAVGLADIPGIAMIAAAPDTTRLSWFAAIARLDPWFDRDRVIANLANRGIPARAYFSPLHLQPVYRERFGFRGGEFAVTEQVARTTLALPFFNAISRDQIEMVCAQVGAVLADERASGRA